MTSRLVSPIELGFCPISASDKGLDVAGSRLYGNQRALWLRDTISIFFSFWDVISKSLFGSKLHIQVQGGVDLVSAFVNVGRYLGIDFFYLSYDKIREIGGSVFRHSCQVYGFGFRTFRDFLIDDPLLSHEIEYQISPLDS